MKIFVKKTLSGLVPASRTEFDKLQESKLKLGDFYEVEIKKKRNVKFHRKFFALLNICFENQEQFDSIEEFRAYLTMKSGFVKVVDTGNGQMFLPKSISFSKMDNTEFSEFYDRCFAQALMILDCTNEDLIEALNDF